MSSCSDWRRRPAQVRRRDPDRERANTDPPLSPHPASWDPINICSHFYTYQQVLQVLQGSYACHFQHDQNIVTLLLLWIGEPDGHPAKLLIYTKKPTGCFLCFVHNCIFFRRTPSLFDLAVRDTAELFQSPSLRRIVTDVTNQQHYHKIPPRIVRFVIFAGSTSRSLKLWSHIFEEMSSVTDWTFIVHPLSANGSGCITVTQVLTYTCFQPTVMHGKYGRSQNENVRYFMEL